MSLITEERRLDIQEIDRRPDLESRKTDGQLLPFQTTDSMASSKAIEWFPCDHPFD